MEKCVHILIEYLSNKPHLLLVLAMQCNKLSKNNTAIHLKQHQCDRLINKVLVQFIAAASNHVQQLNRASAKAKTFLDFSMNVYELYNDCAKRIKSSCFSDFSRLLIDCYCLCHSDSEPAITSNVEFQQALDYYGSELNRRATAHADKMAKKLTIETNESDNNPSTSTNTNSTTKKASKKATKPKRRRNSQVKGSEQPRI